MEKIAPYSPREEFANAVTHGVGFLVAVAALVHMIHVAPLQLSVWQKTAGVGDLPVVPGPADGGFRSAGDWRPGV